MPIQHLSNLLQTKEKQIQNITQLVYAVLANVCVKMNCLQSTNQELNTYWLSNSATTQQIFIADISQEMPQTSSYFMSDFKSGIFTWWDVNITTSSLQETTKTVVHHSLCTAYGRHRLTTSFIFLTYRSVTFSIL